MVTGLTLAAGVGAGLAHLRVLGHQPQEILGTLAVRLVWGILLSMGLVLASLWARVRPWRLSVTDAALQEFWLNAPSRCMRALGLAWTVAAIVLVPASVWRGETGWDVLASVGMLPLVVACPASLFAYEHAARGVLARLETRTLPAGVPRLRVSVRLLVLAVLLAVVPIAALGGSVLHVLAGHSADAGHTHDTLVRLLCEVGAGAALAGVALGVMAARSVTLPLQALNHGLTRLRTGDATVRLPVTSSDELGLAAEMFNKMAAALGERAWLLETFGQYVSPAVAQALREGRISTSGEERTVTVLFADIRGFTRMSEGMRPPAVLTFVNEYVDCLVEAAVEFGGRLDKVMGDGLLLVFGAPEEDDQHARHAVQAAMAMRAALGQLNERRAARGEPAIKIGMGLHTGTVIAGSVGCSAHKLEYTVLGDAVNVASRVEGLCKELGEEILITAATLEAARPGPQVRELPAASVRGRTKLVTLYALDHYEALD